MTTDSITAAVARLEKMVYGWADPKTFPREDIRIVLAALDAARAESLANDRRTQMLANSLRENYYCECCDRAPAKPVQLALAAIEAATKDNP